MKKNFLLFFSLFLFTMLKAQYKVRFTVTEMTNIKHDNIFIAGTFNNWDSIADKRYKLEADASGKHSITLSLPAGDYKYKFTGGNWHTVEKNQFGNEKSDRLITISRDTVTNDTVWAWRDLILREAKWRLAKEQNDTTRLFILGNLAGHYAQNTDYYNVDSALYYIQQTSQLLSKIKSSVELNAWPGYPDWLMYTREMNASFLHALGNYPKSLEYRLENMQFAEENKSPFRIMTATMNLLDDYIAMKDNLNVLAYSKQLKSSLLAIDSKDPAYHFYLAQALYRIAYGYYSLGMQDSSLHYVQQSNDTATRYEQVYDMVAARQLMGDIYAKKGNTDSAFYYYRQSLPVAYKYYIAPVAVLSETGLARLFQKTGKIDSALFYARRSFALLKNKTNDFKSWGQTPESYLAELTPLIAELYKSANQPDSAYKYLQLSVELKDKLYNTDKVRQFQNLSFNETMRQQQLEQQSKEAEQEYTTKVKIYSLITVMLAILVLAFILYRNNKQKQKANAVLQTQKQAIETTLSELKITQTQLVQSEKMASLGELTAGIAHEIQNPLNFVNNFSEVNTELLDELNLEAEKGNLEEVKLIAKDIKENEQKINHHGKRADAIVKGMLQHSRSSGGQKEPTNINALADEYLRLSYHGLRAKDKSFNATLKTDYDESIGNINIIPQDIGRVILNLITNAFYAVNEKKNASSGSASNTYEPIVTVTTKAIKLLSGGLGVSISVRDNGNGIPQNIVDKIFQPFFTTKPTGQGTGLGLSLSYDIIKAHGGEIKVDTKEKEGTAFIITLPL